MHHLANWIEIPVSDFERAKSFYERVLEVELAPMTMGDMQYAMFPTKDVHNTGALVKGAGYAPATDGPLVYLDATDRLEAVLGRIGQAGGRVVMPSTLVSPEAGLVAIFVDSEGNRIGLQSPMTPPDALPVSDETMRGLLGGTRPTIAFVLRRGPVYDDPSTQHLQWEHARNMLAQLRDGKLGHVFAMMDGTDVLGVGTFAIEDRAEAEQILRADPAVRGGRLTYELLTSMAFTRGEVRV